MSWSETLEHVSGRLGFRLDHFDVRLSTLDDYVYQLEEVWTPEADRLDLSDFNDTLVQYSTIILRHRILEDTEGLGEVLYRVLCAGGLPCGCEGEWPSEPVIVYWPHQIPPKFE